MPNLGKIAPARPLPMRGGAGQVGEAGGLTAPGGEGVSPRVGSAADEARVANGLSMARQMEAEREEEEREEAAEGEEAEEGMEGEPTEGGAAERAKRAVGLLAKIKKYRVVIAIISTVGPPVGIILLKVFLIILIIVPTLIVLEKVKCIITFGIWCNTGSSGAVSGSPARGSVSEFGTAR